METIVFLGPTLPVAEAERILPATYLPPAGQGDVYRAVRAHRPRAIGLIDGHFLQGPAVWHREILWAMDEGVRVFGAASMGALRAAELDAYGMAGVGRIYAAYREGRFAPYDEPFEDDDEVALIHAPSELGWLAVSDAMVDLRATLAEAEAVGILGLRERDALVRAMKGLHFPERSFARLAETAPVLLAPPQARAFLAWLPDNRIFQKRRDALLLLDLLGSSFDAMPEPPTFRFETALVWEQFVRSQETLTADEMAVLEALGRSGKAWDDTAMVARGRLAAIALAEEIGGHVEGDALARQLDRFRQERGLMRRAELDAWLQRNGLSGRALTELLAREAAIAAAPEPAGLRQAMVDGLRLSGDYAVWADRVSERS